MKKFLTLSCVALLGLSACDPADFIANMPTDPDQTISVWVNADVQNGKMGPNATMIAGNWSNPNEVNFFQDYFKNKVFFALEADTDYIKQKRFINKNAYVWDTPHNYLNQYGKLNNGTVKYLSSYTASVADADPTDETVEVVITTKRTTVQTREILGATLVPAKFFVSTAFVKDWDFVSVDVPGTGLLKKVNPYGDGLVYYFPDTEETKDFTGYIVMEPNKFTLMPQDFPFFSTHKAFGDYFTVYAPLNAKGEVMFKDIPTPDGLKSWPEKLFIEGISTLGHNVALDLRVLDVNPNIEVGVVQYLQEPNKANGMVHPETYNAEILKKIDAFLYNSDYKQTKISVKIDDNPAVIINYVPFSSPELGTARPADYTLGLVL